MTRGLAVAALLFFTNPAFAQSFDLSQIMPAGEGAVSARIIQVFVLLSMLSIAPGLLVMVTSFTRFAIALSFLRSSIGLQSTPANLVMISLSIFMTLYVMAPTFDKAWQSGVGPLLENKIGEREAIGNIAEPFRAFMLANAADRDLRLFADLAPPAMKQAEDKIVDFRILIPAFMISELRRGFEIGFLIAMPFLVIDMIVATLVMSMGMMMMPPSVIALPLKILFFVLIDGWNLLAGSLVRSYQ